MSAAMNNERSDQNETGNRSASMAALSDTIGALEARLEELMAARKRPAAEEDAAHAGIPTEGAGPTADPIAQIRERQRRLDAFRQRTARARDTAASGSPEAPPAPASPGPALSADGSESGSDLREVAAALVSLKRELRTQLRQDFGQDMARQVGGLRSELVQIKALAERDTMPEAIGAELSRLSRRIEALAEPEGGDADGLHSKMSALNARLEGLALDETLKTLDRRWADISAMLSESNPGSVREELKRLESRVEDLRASVSALPGSDWGSQVEEQLQALTSAVDYLINDETAGDRHREDFAAINARLDDVSTAVATLSAHDSGEGSAAIERVETRLNALVDGVENLRNASNPDLVKRLDVLGERIDAIAAQDIAGPLADRLDHLSEQVAALDRDASAEVVEEIAGYLQDISRKIDALPAAAGGLSLDPALVDRFEALVQRAEVGDKSSADTKAGLASLHRHLEDITRRLDRSEAESPASDDGVRGLETQIANLTRLMSDRSDFADDGGLVALEPRLHAIEQHMTQSHGDIVEAASKAAERAVASFLESGADEFEGGADEMSAMRELAQDLRALNEMTRASDERQARAFDAVHDTLVKIAERLEHLDRAHTATVETPVSAARAEATVAEPAAASAEAGEVSLAADERPARQDNHATSASPSLLGRLAQRVRPRQQTGAEEAREPDAVKPARDRLAPTPPIDPSDTLEPDAANEPLEPGSGTPDINRILQKVRQQQEQSGTVQVERSDAERADFIAAARRAAQAAAADVENATQQRASRKGGPKKTAETGNKRRPILIAVGAVLLAVMSYPLVSNHLKDRPAEDGEPSVAAVETTGETMAETSGKQEGDAAEPTATSSKSLTRPAEKAALTAETEREGTIPPGADPAELPSTDANSTASVTPNPPEAARASEATTNTDTLSTATEDVRPQTQTRPTEPQSATTSGASPLSPETAALIESVEGAPIAPALLDAARNGNPKALYELGTIYAEGKGVEANETAAAQWYRAAAERGLAPAEYRLGNLYEKGMGVERDMQAAERWYLSAAAAGNVSAMHNLAVLYASGVNGEPDYGRAAQWFERAARHGVGDSQFNLAVLYARGSGVAQDLARSYKWFAIAAENGDTDAANKRDEVANAMEEAALDRARAEVELWSPEPMNPDANEVSIPAEWALSDTRTASIDRVQALRDIQTMLNRQGFDAGPSDGVLGDKTASAIRAFQKANGLEPTGRIDRDFVRTLLEGTRTNG